MSRSSLSGLGLMQLGGLISGPQVGSSDQRKKRMVEYF